MFSGPARRFYLTLIFAVLAASIFHAHAQTLPVVTNDTIIFYQWPASIGGNDHWYGFSMGNFSPQKAEDVARQWNGTLANLTDPGEFEFVTARAREEKTIFLTGLAADPNAVFKWPDGTAATLEFMQTNRYPSITNTTTHRMAYWIGVQNQFMTIFSNSFFTRVLFEITNHPSLLPPVFQIVPASRDHYSHSPSADFQARAVGAPPLHYQWYVDDNAIPGATNFHYTMQITTLSTGRVSVVVTNLNGSIRSTPVELTIVPVQFTGSLGWGQWRIEHGGNDHWYGSWVGTNFLTWPEAREFAERLGADLVTVQSESEWQRLLRFTTGFVSYFPLGLSDSDHEGSFHWVDGEPLSFQKWAAGEPSNTDPDADFVVANGPEWFTVTSSNKFLNAWFERTNSPAQMAPVILSPPPAPFLVSLGATRRLEFDVLYAAGSTFEWHFNGQPYSTNTEPLLTFRPETTNQTGIYTMIVKSSAGSATSGPVNITVFDPQPIRTSLLFDPATNLFQIQFNVPTDVEKVIVESSYDLTNWFSREHVTPAVGDTHTFKDSFQPDGPNPILFFRLQRWP